METIKLEKHQGRNLIFTTTNEFCSEGNRTILLVANDEDKVFLIYDENGQERWFTYEQFNEYFRFEK